MLLSVFSVWWEANTTLPWHLGWLVRLASPGREEIKNEKGGRKWSAELNIILGGYACVCVCGYMNWAGVCGRVARELWICLCLHQIRVGHQAACNLSDTQTQTHTHTPSTMCTQCPLYWPPCPCNRDDQCIVHHVMLVWKHTLVSRLSNLQWFRPWFPDFFLEPARKSKRPPFDVTDAQPDEIPPPHLVWEARVCAGVTIRRCVPARVPLLALKPE